MSASVLKLRDESEEISIIHGMLYNLRNAGFIIYENRYAPREITLPSVCQHSEENTVRTNFDGIKCVICEPKWLRPCGVCTAPNYLCAC